LIEMKLDGLRELSKQLQLLPERVARNALRSAVYAGARVVRKAVQARAPVATGKLKASVYQKQIREHSNLYTQVFFVGVRSGARKKRDGSKDFSRDAWYWRMHEMGTSKMAARPFVRPAFMAAHEEAARAIATKLADRISEEARRS
jgi:HK97 gp10 family phage protein